MLYDNALLTLCIPETYRVTKDAFYRMAAERTLAYAMGELRDENGGFCCGQDADNEGIEGKYYVFTKEEIHTVLGETDGTVFCRWFGVNEQEILKEETF